MRITLVHLQAPLLIAVMCLLAGATAMLAAASSDFDQGVRLYGQHKYKEAIPCFDRAISANARAATPFYYKALSLQQMGDQQGAVQIYTTITLLFPGSPEAKLASTVLDRVRALAVAKLAPQASPSPGPSAIAEASDNSSDKAFDRANVSDAELSKMPDQAVIPFVRGPGGHLMVTAFVNNHPIQVMFDTGASTCLFGENNLTASSITDALMTGHTGLIGGVGGSQAAREAIVNLRVGDLSRRMPVTIVKNLGMQPLLGETFYNGYKYDIDNQGGVIRLIKKTSGRSSTPYDAIEVPFEQVGNNMVVTAKVNGRTCPMYFDTGAGHNAFSMATFISLGLSIPSTARITAGTGVAGTAIGYQFDIDRIELGAVRVSNIPVTVFVQGGPPIPLLGQPFLRSRRFTIDNDKHMIQFVR